MKSIKVHEIENNIYELISSIGMGRQSRLDIFMRGKKVAVIISPEELERLEEESERLNLLRGQPGCSDNVYELKFSPQAKSFIDRLDPNERERLDMDLKKMATGAHENHTDDMKILPYFRYRNGKRRILFDVDHANKVLHISKIGMRKDIYR